MVTLTQNPIDVQQVIARASHEGAGAVNVFVGTIRPSANGKAVVRLEYEAYDAMAVSEAKRIADDAGKRWKLLGWEICHRLGVVKPGEVAVVIAVSTPHRKESFEACQFIIDQLKQKVPIFKKEVFEDGEEWVDARNRPA